jgi:predicted glycosyltransferase
MVGFGHIRRNASIAQALRASTLRPAVMMIAEAWQAGTLPMPPGVDCVTLPSLRKEAEGCFAPRFVDISDDDLIALRRRVIRGAVEGFDPDVLIVDHLPLGAARELTETLELLRKRGRTCCVLGLRDVLQDRETVQRTWIDSAHLETVRDYYQAIWVYADPAVYDLVHEYDIFDGLASRVRFTGYLDQRPRLDLASSHAEGLLASLPPGRLALCLVGGGYDGDPLAEAFVHAELPADMTGVVVTGPYMPEDMRQRLTQAVRECPRMRLIDFLADPIPLVDRADRVIAMGGYNSVCEVLSFEKHALIVPRAGASSDQWIRAQRMRDLGLIEVLPTERLTTQALTEWLGRDLGPPPDFRSRVDLDGLARIPGLLADLLGVSASPARGPITFVTPAWAVK